MNSTDKKDKTENSFYNSGVSFSHPLESSYALARRLQIANPVASLKESATLYRRFIATEPVDSIERYLPQDSTIHSVRQCPLCAKHMFHPSVYRVPGMFLCPVHDIRFSRSCPDCGQSWERPLYVRHPQCETCCFPPWETLGRIALKRKQYRRLRWLNNWLTRCQIKSKAQPYYELLDLYGLLRPATSVESPRFLLPTLDHPLYPAFEAQKQNGIPNARLARLHIHTVDLAVKTRTTKLKQFNTLIPPQFQGFLGSKSTYTASKSEQSTLFSLAIRRILRWQCRTLGCSHRLTWYDLRDVRAEQVKDGDTPCILCMAFSFWCCAMTLKLHDPSFGGTPGEHELCRFADYRSYPQIPEAVYFEDDERRCFRPSRSFERWLFLRSSDYAFMEFVYLSLWLYHRSNNGCANFRQTTYPSSEKFYRPEMQLSELLELRLEEGVLHAKFWLRSPLQEINLSSGDVRTIRQCDPRSRDICPRVWSVAPTPKQMNGTMIRDLLDRILPRYRLRPKQYVWTQYYPFDQPPPSCRPFISFRQPQNNMTLVVRS